MNFIRRLVKSGAIAIALVVAMVTGAAAGGGFLYQTNLGPVTIAGPTGGVLQMIKATVGAIAHTVQPGGLVSTVDLTITNTSDTTLAPFSIFLTAGADAIPANKVGLGMVVMTAEFPFAGPPAPSSVLTDISGPILVKPGGTIYVKIDVRALSNAQPSLIPTVQLTLEEGIGSKG